MRTHGNGFVAASSKHTFWIRAAQKTLEMLDTDKLLTGMQQVNYLVKQILWANTCNVHTE